MKSIKKFINYLWCFISEGQEENYSDYVIKFNKKELQRMDDIFCEHLKIVDGSMSTNYIPDKMIYQQILATLKRIELTIHDRLFLIDILKKFGEQLYPTEKP